MDVYQVLNLYTFLGIIVLLIFIKQLVVTKFIPYLKTLIQSKFK
jgi:hypothetical protein